MCEGCYVEYGRPTIINDKTLAGIGLVKRVYDYSMSGGNLHVHLDDWNIEDEFFDKFEMWDKEASPEQIAAEKECFEAFKSMTLEERASVLAMHDGYLKTGTNG